MTAFVASWIAAPFSRICRPPVVAGRKLRRRYGQNPFTTRASSSSSSSSSSPSSASPADSRPTTPSTRLSYYLAASAAGKERRFHPQSDTYSRADMSNKSLGLRTGETQAVQRASRPNSGQDAFFVAETLAQLTTFGVADGVGGWDASGVDSAEFSHGLCHHLASTALRSSASQIKPQALLEAGYQLICQDKRVRAGSSTACVGVVAPDGVLRVANLGDSGFLHLRLDAIQGMSDPQTHHFNAPYQLTAMPPYMLRQYRLFGGLRFMDFPDMADTFEFQLRHGDVLILATDGVWDNLNPQEVLSIVSASMRRMGAWQEGQDGDLQIADSIVRLITSELASDQGHRTLEAVIAAAIAGEAKLASNDKRRHTPFSQEAAIHFPSEKHEGGKVDDVCVVALIAVNKDLAPASSDSEG